MLRTSALLLICFIYLVRGWRRTCSRSSIRVMVCTRLKSQMKSSSNRMQRWFTIIWLNAWESKRKISFFSADRWVADPLHTCRQWETPTHFYWCPLTLQSKKLPSHCSVGPRFYHSLFTKSSETSTPSRKRAVQYSFCMVSRIRWFHPVTPKNYMQFVLWNVFCTCQKKWTTMSSNSRKI